ncbi:MAG TPA: hypothetical protein VL400_15045 [Polyangiaceae bacterium]|nr:hypothetical protein [Polyangiaceae bacterium]
MNLPRPCSVSWATPRLLGWSLLLSAACAPASPDPVQERGGFHSTDALAEGTCDGACGEQSDDGCWCDDLCDGYGDCCADYHATCDAPAPPSKLDVRLMVPPKIAADGRVTRTIRRRVRLSPRASAITASSLLTAGASC